MEFSGRSSIKSTLQPESEDLSGPNPPPASLWELACRRTFHRDAKESPFIPIGEKTQWVIPIRKITLDEMRKLYPRGN